MGKAIKAERLPRYASRLETMHYARVGSTRMTQWLKGVDGNPPKLKARKDGARVIIDLNDVDDLIATLPSTARVEES